MKTLDLIQISRHTLLDCTSCSLKIHYDSHTVCMHTMCTNHHHASLIMAMAVKNCIAIFSNNFDFRVFKTNNEYMQDSILAIYSDFTHTLVFKLSNVVKILLRSSH